MVLHSKLPCKFAEQGVRAPTSTTLPRWCHPWPDDVIFGGTLRKTRFSVPPPQTRSVCVCVTRGAVRCPALARLDDAQRLVDANGQRQSDRAGAVVDPSLAAEPPSADCRPDGCQRRHVLKKHTAHSPTLHRTLGLTRIRSVTGCRCSICPHVTVPATLMPKRRAMAQVIPLRTHTFRLDNCIIDDYAAEIGPALLVYTVLQRYADRATGQCWPSIATIAGKLGIGTNSVRKHVQHLAALGLISIATRSTPEKATSHLIRCITQHGEASRRRAALPCRSSCRF